MPIPRDDEFVYGRSRSERSRTLISPSLKMPKAIVVVEDVSSCFGETLSLGKNKAFLLPRKTKGGSKRMDDPPPVFSFRSAGKLQLDKKPNTTKPKGIAKSFYFRPVEESLLKAKKRYRFEEEDECRVTGVTDLSARIEAINSKEDMDEIFFGGHEGLKRQSHKFASAAISYLQDKGHKVELVEAGSYEGEMAWRYHHNFKAKRADDSRAPVEMYFAQLYCGGSRLLVECCVSLGKPDSLPYERDNQGCEYCTQFVHHPHGDCQGIILSKW